MHVARLKIVGLLVSRLFFRVGKSIVVRLGFQPMTSGSEVRVPATRSVFTAQVCNISVSRHCESQPEKLTFDITGFSSSLSIGIEVECTQVCVHRCCSL